MRRPAIHDLAVLSAVGLTGLLIGVTLGQAARPTAIASPGPSGVAVGPSNGPTAAPTPGPSPFPSVPTASPPPRPGPCEVPEAIPVPPAAVAAPRIEARNLAVVFTSYLYERSPGGQLFAQDSDARYGLWFAPAGATEARLLAATENAGAVLPLGLSPSGETAAVWYQPESRVWGGPACPSGIYLLSTTDGTSRLVMQRDWRVMDDDDGIGEPNDTVGHTWLTNLTQGEPAMVHLLPEAVFSANGRAVAFVERERIIVVGPGKDPFVVSHVGECSAWAWAPLGATFVAGCEKMTNAWLMDFSEGYGEDFFPLPLPDRKGLFRNWDRWPAATIGFTPAGDIRLVRFYGFATGCEGPGGDCFIPRPAWSVTSIDPISGEQRSRYTEVDFLTDVQEVGRDARLSSDASWVYVRGYDAVRAVTVSLDSGAIRDVRRLGDPAGASADGELLFDSQLDEVRDMVVIRSIDRTGKIREVGTIAWPAGAGTDDPIIATYGLAVASPEG